MENKTPQADKVAFTTVVNKRCERLINVILRITHTSATAINKEYSANCDLSSGTHNCQLNVLGGIENIIQILQLSNCYTFDNFMTAIKKINNDSGDDRRMLLLDIHNRYSYILVELLSKSNVILMNSEYISTNGGDRNILLIKVK